MVHQNIILRSLCCLAVICLVISPITSSFALSEESQKILNKYQDYKENGYAPIPNKKTANTQQISQPSKSSSQQSQQNTNNRSSVSLDGSQSWIVIGIVIILIIAVVAGATRGGGSSSRPWGSYSNPPSSKQIWRLREAGYRGPMPTSSRDAHERISDIDSGGDGMLEGDDDYDDGRSRYG